jgi:tRNA threonylcarbamoyl adenosine modification protein YjeE
MNDVFERLHLQPVSETFLEDEAATDAFARKMAQVAQANDFIGLVGELGAGKTTFARGFVDELSGQEATSPTYTLVNVYEGNPPIYHFDLWRLEDIDGLESIGYWDYLDQGAICLVEWLDRVPEAWPRRGCVVQLKREQGGRRAIVWGT